MSGHGTASNGGWLIRNLKKIAKNLWGEFESWQELRKFLLLSVVFFFVIGVYWTLRPIKDSAFDALVGLEEWQPLAKVLSMLVVFPLVIFYSKLIEWYRRERVFYLLTTIYALIAVAFFVLFYYHPTYALTTVVRNTFNWPGWAWYVYVESFGSLIVALFWAITSDVTMPEAAKRGYPLIAFGGQLGNVVGPFFLRAKKLGFASGAPIIAICAAGMICAAAMLYLFLQVTPPHLLKGYHGKDEAKKEAEQEPGFLEGLWLLFSNWYLIAIFFITSVFEVVITFIDYNFKATVMNTFVDEATRGSYLGEYATWVGIIALASIALGINNVQRWIGMRAALVLLPVIMLIAIIGLKVSPGALPILFWIMIFSKALNYALNVPVIRQAYIPTTHDVKYKAQAWSDSFGSRGAKAFSSGVNFTKPHLFVKMFGPFDGAKFYFLTITGLSMGLIGVWFVAAFYVARLYNKAIKENRVVC